LVVECFLVDVDCHGEAWGAETPWQVKQVVAAPPLKSAPWQAWQVLKPVMFATFGANFAEAPWTSALAHPTAWPTWPWQSVLSKHPTVCE
jgi:hypothetical protein